MNLPIGEIFETLIHWLKIHLEHVFDVISATINFAINLLERVLSVDAAFAYPVVIIVVLVALLCFGLANKKMGWKAAAVLSMLVIPLGLGLDSWRHQILETRVGVEDLANFTVQMDELRLHWDSSLHLESETPEQAQRLFDRIEKRVRQAKVGQNCTSVFLLRDYEHLRRLLAEVRNHNPHSSPTLIAMEQSLKRFHPKTVGLVSLACLHPLFDAARVVQCR